MFSHLAPKERMAYGALFLLFLAFAGYVGAQRTKSHPPIQIYESKPEGQKPGAGVIPPTPKATDQLVVHVAGAVNKPGVYKLGPDARIVNAIQAADGFRKDADQDQLNMAAKLVDGTQVYVPIRSADAPTPQVDASYSGGPATTSSPSKPSKSGGKSFSGSLNLNTATADQLQQIPGIGPSTAQRILDYRKEHGRFKSIDELTAVGGIGEKKLERMRVHLRI